MASAVGLLGGEPALPLKSKLPVHGVPTIRLECMVPVQNQPTLIKRRATCSTISDSVEPEWVLKVVKEFRDTFAAGRLYLNTGTLRKEFFRQLLSGGALRKWDVEADQVGNSTNDFDAAIDGWISRYINDTALANQEAFMRLVKAKPYSLSVQECADRIEEINSYMGMFPGGPGFGQVVFDEQDLKNILYSKMLQPWQDAFAEGTQELTDNAYTLRRLTAFMVRQELTWNRRQNHLSRGSNAGRGGNRGGNHQGRGGGRGGAGRGGRGGFARHQPYPLQNQRPRFQYGYGGNYNAGQGRGGYNYAPMGFRQAPYQYQQQAQGYYNAGRGAPHNGAALIQNAAHNIVRGGGRGRFGSSGRGAGRFGGRGFAGRQQGRGNYSGGRGDNYVADISPSEEAPPAVSPNSAAAAATPMDNMDHYYEDGTYQEQEFEGHWVDEQFGIFDDGNGYDDGQYYHGYGDY